MRNGTVKHQLTGVQPLRVLGVYVTLQCAVYIQGVQFNNCTAYSGLHGSASRLQPFSTAFCQCLHFP